MRKKIRRFLCWIGIHLNTMTWHSEVEWGDLGNTITRVRRVSFEECLDCGWTSNPQVAEETKPLRDIIKRHR